MKDDRAEAEQLLGMNVPFIERLLTQHTICIGGIPVFFKLYFTGDFAGVRAIENCICGCPPEAMHTVPSTEVVATLPALQLTCANCDCKATVAQRTSRAHELVDGEVVPCDCCSFGHDHRTATDEHAAFASKLRSLQEASHTTAGKKVLSSFLSSHKRKHRGTHPGEAGIPLFSAGLSRWIVDLLHVDLNHGKLVWKWALTRRLPADVRAAISEYLKSVGLPLDLRTKEEGRVAADKFYEGGHWHVFCYGGGRAPGGAVLVATLVKIVADHYEELVTMAASEREQAALAGSIAATTAPTAASERPSKRKNKGGAVVYSSASTVSADKDDKRPWREAFEKAKEAAATEAEKHADKVAMSIIRQRYGESSERLIAMLLAFDALFAFRKTMRCRFDSDDMDARKRHALLFAKHRECQPANPLPGCTSCSIVLFRLSAAAP